MKTHSKAKRETCCLNQVKIKIGTEKQIYDYCVCCLRGANVYTYRKHDKEKERTMILGLESAGHSSLIDDNFEFKFICFSNFCLFLNIQSRSGINHL